MVNDFYCGVKRDPRNRRIGTMKECTETGDIRYYGLNKIDPILLKRVNLEKKYRTDLTKKWKKIVGLNAKIKKLKNDIIYLKDKKKKEKAKKELIKIIDERKELVEEYILLKKK